MIKIKLENSIKNLILSSSAHGLPKIFKTRHSIIKIMWSISLIISISTCIYLVIETILNYLSFEVTSHFNVIYEIPTEFPTVSFCNKNRPKIKYSIKEFLLSCTFYKTNCSSKDFIEFQDQRYGRCYRFNSGFSSNGTKNNILKTYTTGRQNGLKLELFLGFPNESTGTHRDDGFHFYVHNNTVNPMANEGFGIASSFLTEVLVNRFFYKKLSYPYSDCLSFSEIKSKYSGSIYYDELVKYNYSYRQKDCFEICIQNRTNDLEQSKNYVDLCSPFCPIECETISYTTFITISDYPSVTRQNTLLKDPIIRKHFENITVISNDFLKKSVLSVFVYYSDLKYTLFSESEKMLPFELISSIGGTLGLFIGVSFLSFLEIIEFFYEVCCLVLKAKTTKVEVINSK